MIWETKKRSTFWLGWVRQTAINPITESLRASSPFCPFMIIALYTGHIWIQYTMRKKSGLVFLMALLSCCENITTELICAAFTWFKQLSQRTFHVFSHVYVVLESNLVWTCLDQNSACTVVYSESLGLQQQTKCFWDFCPNGLAGFLVGRCPHDWDDSGCSFPHQKWKQKSNMKQ